LCYYLTENLRS